MESKNCLECESCFAGREDKKFCSDWCRNTFNNRQNKDANNMIRNINNRLRKNWRILEELNPEDKRKISKEKLDAKGFDYSYYTGIQASKSGIERFCVYDQCYEPLENDYFELKKRN